MDGCPLSASSPPVPSSVGRRVETSGHRTLSVFVPSGLRVDTSLGRGWSGQWRLIQLRVWSREGPGGRRRPQERRQVYKLEVALETRRLPHPHPYSMDTPLFPCVTVSTESSGSSVTVTFGTGGRGRSRTQRTSHTRRVLTPTFVQVSSRESTPVSRLDRPEQRPTPESLL